MFNKLEGIPVKVQRWRIDVAREPLRQRVAQGRQSLEMAALDPLITHVCSSIAKFSAPLPNTFVTHKVWSIHCTHSAMNFSCTMAFSLQKSDHCVNLALAGSFYNSTQVNMLIAQ
jgi:hypothetical protein